MSVKGGKTATSVAEVEVCVVEGPYELLDEGDCLCVVEVHLRLPAMRGLRDIVRSLALPRGIPYGVVVRIFLFYFRGLRAYFHGLALLCSLTDILTLRSLVCRR